LRLSESLMVCLVCTAERNRGRRREGTILTARVKALEWSRVKKAAIGRLKQASLPAQR
jgi:hypothetical protein